MNKILIALVLFFPAFLGCNPASYNPPPGPPGTCVGKHTEQGLFGSVYYIRIEPNSNKYEDWDWQVDGVTYDKWEKGDRLFWPNYKGSYYR